MTSRNLPRAAAWPVALLALLVGSRVSRANFVLLDQHLELDRAAHRAEFTLTFNQRPDFFTVDSDGREKDSFQIEFDGDPLHSSRNGGIGLTGIVRGEEIHFAHALRIRAAAGDGGPMSGGWGPVMETVPFKLDGDTLTFTTTTEALGLVGQPYRYSAFSLEFGGLTAQQNVQFVPLHTAAAMFPAGALVAAYVMWRMRHHRRA